MTDQLSYRLREIEGFARIKRLTVDERAYLICDAHKIVELGEMLGGNPCEPIVKAASKMGVQKTIGRALHLKGSPHLEGQKSPRGRPRHHHIDVLVRECCNAWRENGKQVASSYNGVGAGPLVRFIEKTGATLLGKEYKTSRNTLRDKIRKYIKET